jgi:opacity protein-like surface antigen
VPLSFTLPEKLEKAGHFGLSAHGGVAVPLGNFADYYNPSYYVGMDLEYHFNRNFAAIGLAGFSNFKLASGDETDYWANISVGPRYTHTVGPVFASIIAGAGIYIPEDGSNEVGVHAGVGLSYPIHRHWTVELGQTYHRVFCDADDIDFTVTHAGACYRF